MVVFGSWNCGRLQCCIFFHCYLTYFRSPTFIVSLFVELEYWTIALCYYVVVDCLLTC
ncbi:hypothetical protein RchiOBHm_Chr2g0133061 [Rosa chinensis]|uniref:Uncharacterized protein n=1 Tax=Rosa chinensis TaxID=74649 RepID=A0A2P6RVG9_ROSCH|nr:hypothetical protein RchiOBHm_Chr2g0133061 [Rosa chinensis]